jgi:hypothetical protein
MVSFHLDYSRGVMQCVVLQNWAVLRLRCSTISALNYMLIACVSRSRTLRDHVVLLLVAFYVTR